ncbi:MAG: hypothetical protein R3B84_15265 [Zavarzinella sp.]
MFFKRNHKVATTKPQTRLSIETLEGRDLMAADPFSTALPTEFFEQAQVATMEVIPTASFSTIGELTGAYNTPFSNLLMTNVQTYPDGAIKGQVEIAGLGSFEVLADVNGSEDWTIAIKATSGDMINNLPLINQFDFKSPIIIYTSAARTLESGGTDSLSQFVGTAYTGDFKLALNQGFHVLAGVGIRDGSIVDQAITPFTGETPDLMFHAVGLKDYSAQSLVQSFNKDSILSDLKDSIEVRVYLQGLTIDLPEGWSLNNPYMFIKGDMTDENLKIGMGLDVQTNTETVLSFRANLVKAENQFGLEAFANVTNWNNAFGLQGFNITAANLGLSVVKKTVTTTNDQDVTQTETRFQIAIDFSAEMQVAGKTINVAGKFANNDGKFDLAFRGELSSVSSHELVAVVNHLIRMKNPLAPSIPADMLPNIELRNFAINYSPTMGSDSTLGIEAGIGAKGELYLNGKYLGSADILIDFRGASFQIKADVPLLDLGIVKVQNVVVDVLIAPRLDSHFLIKGQANLLGSTHMVNINVSRTNMSFQITSQIPGLGMADFKFQSPTSSSPDWKFEATLRNDLGTRITEGVRQLANSANAEFEKAKRDLTNAQNEVNRLNNEISAARAQAKKEYDAFMGEVTKLQNSLNSAQNEVNRLLPGVNSAYTNWQNAIKRTNSAPWWEYAIRKSEEGVAWASYTGQKALYNTATWALNVAKNELNNFRKTAGWIVENGGIDLNPKVASLLAARELATAGLNAANGIVSGFQTATNATLGAIANSFVIKQVKFSGSLTPNQDLNLTLKLDYQIGGQNKSFQTSARVNLNQMASVFSPTVLANRFMTIL